MKSEMKEETSQLITKKYKDCEKLLRTIHINKSNNLKEMESFLKTHKLPRIKHEEIKKSKLIIQ